MKVCIKNSSSGVNKDQIDVVSSFIHFLQDQLPLSKDIHIIFTDNEKDTGTTGMRIPGSKMFILVKNRMLIDILRTLSHEWVHEYQFQKLGLDDKKKIQDIGGPEENMSNVLSGIFIKKFDQSNPNFKNKLYEGKKGNKNNSIEDEIEEIERTVEDLSRNYGIDTSVEEIVGALKSADEVEIPYSVWARLENTHSNTIRAGEMDKVKEIAKEFDKANPLKLAKDLKRGVYNRPLILKFEDRYYLIAGNTRLSTAAAIGMAPLVIIGEI